MKLPKDNPTIFCKAYIRRELEEYKESKIWMSYWPTMERLIDRADELTIVFEELIKAFGYSDKYDGSHPNSTYVWLILEHIWFSSDFSKTKVIKARGGYNKLQALNSDIVELSTKLAKSIREQAKLYESFGFLQSNYQSVKDMMDEASKNNHLYNTYLSPKLENLNGQFDLKYWPHRADLVQAIAEFEKKQPCPKHLELPDTVIAGKASDVKDFVLSFDQKLDDFNDLPTGFRFSNKSMAEIINVILDLPVERLINSDSVKTVRYRHSIP